MNDDKLDDSIKIIENYFFGTDGENGEQLFKNFLKDNKENFKGLDISDSTENRIE